MAWQRTEASVNTSLFVKPYSKMQFVSYRLSKASFLKLPAVSNGRAVLPEPKLSALVLTSSHKFPAHTGKKANQHSCLLFVLLGPSAYLR